MTEQRRLFHRDVAGAFKVLDEVIGCDRRHEIVSAMRSSAAVEAQGERQGFKQLVTLADEGGEE